MPSRTSTTFAPDFTAAALLALHEGDGLEPAAQETPQQFGRFSIMSSVAKIDVGIEMLLDVAEQRDGPALALLFELVAGRRSRSPCRRARCAPSRRAAPAPRRAPCTWMPSRPQPCCCDNLRISQSVSEPSGGDADALALEIGDGPDLRAREHGQREIGGRAVHGGDADRRHALGAEAHARSRAERARRRRPR